MARGLAILALSSKEFDEPSTKTAFVPELTYDQKFRLMTLFMQPNEQIFVNKVVSKKCSYPSGKFRPKFHEGRSTPIYRGVCSYELSEQLRIGKEISTYENPQGVPSRACDAGNTFLASS